MEFDHERLDVYKLSLDFLVFAERLLGGFPRGRAYFADQLGRAALSIVLNARHRSAPLELSQAPRAAASLRV